MIAPSGAFADQMRGAYTTNGNNFTMTPREYSGVWFGDGAAGMGLSTSQWYTQSQLRTPVIQFLVARGSSQANAEASLNEMFRSETATYSLSGNTLTLIRGGDTTILTKQ